MVSSARARYDSGMNGKQRLEQRKLAIVKIDEDIRPQAREWFIRAPKNTPLSYHKLGRMFNRSAQTIKNWSDEDCWTKDRAQYWEDREKHTGGDTARYLLEAADVISTYILAKAKECDSETRADMLCDTMMKLSSIVEKNVRTLEKSLLA